MYIVIRLMIGCVFLVCSTIAVKRSPIARKRMRYMAFTGLSVLLVVLLHFLPFENFFVTFDSPKAAYAYSHWGKSHIALIVEGTGCDLIVDRGKDSDTYLIVPKTAEGWKIGIGSDTKRVEQKISDGIVLYVYRYKNTNDYFITISDTNGGRAAVSDNYNTEILSLERYNEPLGKTFVTYYAHVAGFDPQYSVTVNGTPIVWG